MKYRILLVVAALIWGAAFVAQRVSTETMGPYAFNGIRFALGALSVLPIALWQGRHNHSHFQKAPHHLSLLTACLLIGFILFAGNTLQQIGLIYTTAGKAGFITALYIVAVPIVGILWHNPLRLSHATGCLVAVAGLYLLAFRSDQPLNYGDFLELCGVVFWTLHILFVSRLVRYYQGIHLATGQFIFCSIFSLAGSFLTGEAWSWNIIYQTAIPLLYGGLMSCGIAYTLQIIGQVHVPPTEASLLLSLEMIFSALTGYLILGETMSIREVAGCILMTCGIFAAQVPSRIIWKGWQSKKQPQ